MDVLEDILDISAFAAYVLERWPSKENCRESGNQVGRINFMSVVTDPISDMLTRIRNALAVEHNTVKVPASKVKRALASILKEEGFINDFQLVDESPRTSLQIHLKYLDNGEPVIKGLKRISKPGLRVYVGKGEVPKVYGGVGIAVVSTSKGMMTGSQAWREKVGGELVCKIW